MATSEQQACGFESAFVVPIFEEEDGTVKIYFTIREENGTSTIDVCGGTPNAGETPKDTALRKLKEETGLELAGEALREYHVLYNPNLALEQYWYPYHVSSAQMGRMLTFNGEKHNGGFVAVVTLSPDGKVLFSGVSALDADAMTQEFGMPVRKYIKILLKFQPALWHWIAGLQ